MRPVIPRSGSRLRACRFCSVAAPSVAVAMSGGIDSSVAALLLKRKGYDITGVFMKNWDSSDEIGGNYQCPIDEDFEDMQAVCERLGIRALKVDFVKDYWSSVFLPFVDGFQSNELTPNPDVSCNSQIKFCKFREHVIDKLKFDFMATGHYARVIPPQNCMPAQLLRGIDSAKDQSYFLSTTAAVNFSNVIFPLGDMTKQDVKCIAQDEFKGLRVLSKKESMGICFVGKRKMSDFLPQYIDPTPGRSHNSYAHITPLLSFLLRRFIDVDTGLIVGEHKGSELYTIGQKARIGGAPVKYFVAKKSPSEEDDEETKKNFRKGDIYVASSAQHPSLQSNVVEVSLDDFNWISGDISTWRSDEESPSSHCAYNMQIRYRQKPIACKVYVVNNEEGCVRMVLCDDEVRWLQAATPGQIVAVYKNDVCVGAGPITKAYTKKEPIQ